MSVFPLDAIVGDGSVAEVYRAVLEVLGGWGPLRAAKTNVFESSIPQSAAIAK